MFYSTSILLLSATFALAAPTRFIGKRAASDILVFKFAHVLEQFEAAFYAAALAKFKPEDFTAAGFVDVGLAVEQFTAIGASESTHATVLEAALKSFGETPITGCTFNFDAALKDVATMAATARVVEDTGVAAYLGGATLLTDPILLTSAGAIATVEARHSGVLNILSGTGSAIPSPFDLVMTPSEVLAIAGPFISGCDVGIPANVPLAVTNTGAIGPGTKLEFQSEAITDKTNLFCQMTTGGASFSISLPIDNCVVPDGIDGPVLIHITKGETPLVNNVRDRATTEQVAGPLLTFIDTKRQALSQLAKGAAPEGGVPPSSPTQSSDETVTTETISPSQASEIIAGATTAASAGEPAPTGAPGSEPVGNASSAPPVSSKPNLEKGLSEDGKIEVEGWTGNI
jgi:hypothetical protein